MALGRDGNLHLLQPLLIKNMLHQLFLDNPGLGEGSMSTLSHMLVQNQVPLEVISCSRNALDANGAKHFGDIICGLKTSREIMYIDCHLSIELIATLVQKAWKILPMP
jgi:Ran GTPase-activating protein (RanGAP) involved in mRNA processing and transport